jgi:hypothetical protein
VGKINNKKIFKKNIFSMDRQKLGEVQKKCLQIFSKLFFSFINII